MSLLFCRNGPACRAGTNASTIIYHTLPCIINKVIMGPNLSLMARQSHAPENFILV